MTRGIDRLFLLATWLLLFVAAMELVLVFRWVPPAAPMVEESRMDHFLVHDGVPLWRAAKSDLLRDEGCELPRRLVLLGDSTVFGINVTPRATYALSLREALAPHGWCVHNLAQPGYTWEQSLADLKIFEQEVAPVDVVLLNTWHATQSHRWDTDGRRWYKRRRGAPVDDKGAPAWPWGAGGGLHRWLLRASRSYAWTFLAVDLRWSGGVGFAALREAAVSVGLTRIALFTHRGYHDVSMADLERELGSVADLPLIDTARALLPRAREDYLASGVHLTRSGHEKFADALIPAVFDLLGLPPRHPREGAPASAR